MTSRPVVLRLVVVPMKLRDAAAYVERHHRHSAPPKGYRHEAGDDLWTALVDVLLEVKHAAVILSGYPCAEAERLGWRMVPLARKRTVQSRAGETLARAPEVVWLSPAVPERSLFARVA